MVPQSTKELDDLISEPSEGVIQTLRDLPGRIAVIGAGGKMGFHVCRMLGRALQVTGQPEPVIAVSRFQSEPTRRQFEQAGFDVRCADASDSQQVDQLPDADHVFFLAGIKFGTSGNAALLEKMNVTMPTLIAERYKDARIVALSTGCVYAYTHPDSGGSTEDSRTDPPGQYALSCLGREQAFVANSNKHGTQTALIRLNYSNECRYGVLVDIAQKVFNDECVSLQMGHVNVIWQADAVAHVIQSLAHVSSPPFVLNVTGEKVLAVRDLATMFAERFGKTVSFAGEPAETAWLNNASLSHQLFGKPQVSIDRMVDAIADWIENGRETLGKPTKFEVRDGDY